MYRFLSPRRVLTLIALAALLALSAAIPRPSAVIATDTVRYIFFLG